MSWAHKHDAEWNAFASSNASGDGALLFGRVTYEMMKAFWPTPQAAQMLPEVAKAMNAMPKYVVSRTLDRADWQNTTVLKGDASRREGPEGRRPARICDSRQRHAGLELTEAGLIDGFQLVMCPVVLGKGRTPFEPRATGKAPR